MALCINCDHMVDFGIAVISKGRIMIDKCLCDKCITKMREE